MANFREKYFCSQPVNILFLPAFMTVLSGNFCAAVNTMSQKEKFSANLNDLLIPESPVKFSRSQIDDSLLSIKSCR